MRRLVFFALSAVAACSQKQPHGKNATGKVTVKAPKVDAEVPAMGSTYQKAYDLAKKEVTKDNAEVELDTIEHAVNKDM
ncbi:MAG: hypothetical protein H7Z43_09865 [Clostridia bacterium]|nr:hypothetical protein [Deltaproteobacteria bacterium]